MFFRFTLWKIRSEKFVCVQRFLYFHLICILFNQAMLRILEQIKHDTRIDRKHFLFNDSHLCFIFSQYYNYCWILTEGLKNYEITCTVLLPTATIGTKKLTHYWRVIGRKLQYIYFQFVWFWEHGDYCTVPKNIHTHPKGG